MIGSFPCLSKQFSKAAKTAVPFFVIASATTIICGCGNSDSKTNNVKKETKELLTVEKKALDQNRVLNAEEVKKVTQSFDKIAASISPEDAKKLRAITQSVATYRTAIEAFRALGGAKVETLKSRADLDNRIAMVDDLSAKTKQVEAAYCAGEPVASNLAALKMEGKMLGKIRQQLLFYKAHYGKWQISKSGKTMFAVTPGELAEYNKLAADIRSLGAQQMQLVKKDTEERLGNTK